MKRTLAVAAFSLGLAGCSGISMPSMPSMPSFGLGSPPTTTMQFETEPPGAEARTSTGQTCRTPCSMAIPGSEFTATFTLNGYQSQTIPVRVSSATEAIDPQTGSPPTPQMVPNPVFAALTPTPPPAPPPRKRAPAPRKPAATAAKPASSSPPPAAPAAQAPQPAPAAAWPPPPPAR